MGKKFFYYPWTIFFFNGQISKIAILAYFFFFFAYSCICIVFSTSPSLFWIILHLIWQLSWGSSALFISFLIVLLPVLLFALRCTFYAFILVFWIMLPCYPVGGHQFGGTNCPRVSPCRCRKCVPSKQWKLPISGKPEHIMNLHCSEYFKISSSFDVVKPSFLFHTVL